MSSKITGDLRCPRELTETIRAFPAAVRASCSPTASAKWPRWLVANCISQPSGVSWSSGSRITPALFTSRCSGPLQRATSAPIEAGGCDEELLVAGAGGDIVGNPLASLQVAHREGHLGVGGSQRPGGFDADPGCATCDDRPAAGQVNSGNDLGGGGLRREVGGDSLVVHRATSRAGVKPPTLRTRFSCYDRSGGASATGVTLTGGDSACQIGTEELGVDYAGPPAAGRCPAQPRAAAQGRRTRLFAQGRRRHTGVD